MCPFTYAPVAHPRPARPRTAHTARARLAQRADDDCAPLPCVWAPRQASSHLFFSENLKFKPVGVPGLGTDASPDSFVDADAAGLSSEKLYGFNAEKDGIMYDLGRDSGDGGNDRRGARAKRQIRASVSPDAVDAPLQRSLIYGGEPTEVVGIPQRNPEAFAGAAGISTAERERLSRAEHLEFREEPPKPPRPAVPPAVPRLQLTCASGDEAAAAPSPVSPRVLLTSKAEAGGLSQSERAARADGSMSGPIADMLPGTGMLPGTSGQHYRRGSAVHSEGITSWGGEQLQMAREQHQPHPAPAHGSAEQWAGMPPSFEGAAGMNSWSKNWLRDYGRFEALQRELQPQGAPTPLSAQQAAAAAAQHRRHLSNMRSESFSVLDPQQAAELQATRSQANAGAAAWADVAGGGEGGVASRGDERRSLPWQGMPPSFEGAAGLSSKLQGWIRNQGSSVARACSRDVSPVGYRSSVDQRSSSPAGTHAHTSRCHSPAFDGAAGLTSSEVAASKIWLYLRDELRDELPSRGADGSPAPVARRGRHLSSGGAKPPGAALLGRRATSALAYGDSDADDDGPHILEIPEANPMAFLGAAGLTSAEAALRRSRSLFKFESDAPSRTASPTAGPTGATAGSSRGGSPRPYGTTADDPPPELRDASAQTTVQRPRPRRAAPRSTIDLSHYVPPSHGEYYSVAAEKMTMFDRMKDDQLLHDHAIPAPSQRGGPLDSPRARLASPHELHSPRGLHSPRQWASPRGQRSPRMHEPDLDDLAAAYHSARGTSPTPRSPRSPQRPASPHGHAAEPLFEKGRYGQAHDGVQGIPSSPRSVRSTERSFSARGDFWSSWPAVAQAQKEQAAAESARSTRSERMQ